MWHFISTLIFKIIGWKIGGTYPHNCKKVVIIVMPHTSNWDFPLGILTRGVVRANVKFMGKSSLFKFPFGYLFRAMGGYPVVRNKNSNYVQTVVEIINKESRFHLALSPEGTRSKVSKLRTGFYYIAKAANIPIVMCKFDYTNKTVFFGKPFFTTDDKNADFDVIKNFFKGVKGKKPELGYLYKG